MKKSLLLCSIAAAAISASAAEWHEPTLYEGFSLQFISPNGKWAVSDYWGTVTLINLENNDQVSWAPGDINAITEFNIGSGNALSNDGLLLCAQDTDGSSITYYEGEWKTLECGEANGGYANGITPDGSRICGLINLSTRTLDDVTMCLPAIWDRNADGTYTLKQLPYPTLDLYGRAPQYVKATFISDDGKTICGSITDCRGFYNYPIVYTEAADGTWSYSLPSESLFNPNHLDIVEYPGEAPAEPEVASYMSDEKKAEYDAAMTAWQQSGYKQDLYPNAEDYLTEEEKAAYDAAHATWEAAHTEWSEKFDTWNENYYAILDASPNFQVNEFCLSSNGKKLATTEFKEEGFGWDMVTISHVWEFNLENNEVTKYEDHLLDVHCYAGDTLLATEADTNTGVYNGYLIKDGTVTSLYDYLCSKSDDLKDWCETNLKHEIEGYDYEKDQVTTVEVIASGAPAASSDLGVIAGWTFSYAWGGEVESYLFDLSDFVAIKDVAAAAKSQLGFDANGNLKAGADVASLEVYNVSGVRVLSGKDAKASQLPAGVYLLKATFTDGTTATVKAVK